MRTWISAVCRSCGDPFAEGLETAHPGLDPAAGAVPGPALREGPAVGGWRAGSRRARRRPDSFPSTVVRTSRIGMIGTAPRPAMEAWQSRLPLRAAVEIVLRGGRLTVAGRRPGREDCPRHRARACRARVVADAPSALEALRAALAASEARADAMAGAAARAVASGAEAVIAALGLEVEKPRRALHKAAIRAPGAPARPSPARGTRGDRGRGERGRPVGAAAAVLAASRADRGPRHRRGAASRRRHDRAPRPRNGTRPRGRALRRRHRRGRPRNPSAPRSPRAPRIGAGRQPPLEERMNGSCLPGGRGASAPVLACEVGAALTAHRTRPRARAARRARR